MDTLKRLPAPGEEGLERSCSPEVLDAAIRIGRSNGPIERIEAVFSGNGFSPHRHDTYAIGLTMAGVQTFAYRGEGRFSMPGNIIVLHPDELHDGGAGTDAGLRYRMLYIPPQLIAEASGDEHGGLPFVAAPVFSDPMLAAALGEALGNLDEAPDELALTDQITRIADGLRRNALVVGGNAATLSRRSVARACEYLRENCARIVAADELEAVAELDRYTLARQFRRLTGTSPHRYQVMRRLERARGALLSGMPIAEAAFEAGFADQAHFTRHFKKSYGMTPGRFQRIARA